MMIFSVICHLCNSNSLHSIKLTTCLSTCILIASANMIHPTFFGRKGLLPFGQKRDGYTPGGWPARTSRPSGTPGGWPARTSILPFVYFEFCYLGWLDDRLGQADLLLFLLYLAICDCLCEL